MVVPPKIIREQEDSNPAPFLCVASRLPSSRSSSQHIFSGLLASGLSPFCNESAWDCMGKHDFTLFAMCIAVYSFPITEVVSQRRSTRSGLGCHVPDVAGQKERLMQVGGENGVVG